MAEKKKVYKFPKKMGDCADLITELKSKRSLLTKQAEEIEKEEKALKQYVIDNLPKSNLTGASGKVSQVKVITKDVPQVEDWDLLYKHIKKTGEFDLLNRALNKTAVDARWEAEKKVPGVKSFKVVSLSVTKV